MNAKEKRKRLDMYCWAQTGCSDCLMDGDGFGCGRVDKVPICMSDAEIEIVFDDFKQVMDFHESDIDSMDITAVWEEEETE